MFFRLARHAGLSVAMSWLTYLYFPIGYDLARLTVFFKAAIVANTLLHMFMISLPLLRWYKLSFSKRCAGNTELLR